MSKYENLRKALSTTGKGEMKCFGNSMMPILKSGTTCVFQKQEKYQVDDIVFCRVKGRYIDAHKVIAVSEQRGYLIANNKGHQNGWTKQIFGKVIGTRA